MSVWRESGFTPDIAINLSAQQFMSEALMEQVVDTVSNSDIPPSRIIFEITEGTFMKDPDLTIRIMHRMRSRGFRFSIDDFGTGFSSLSLLSRLPVFELKIDKSFLPPTIADMDAKNPGAMVIKAILSLAHQLGLQITTEGVEHAFQIQEIMRLHSGGGLLFQGYHFSKPVGADAFRLWAQSLEQARANAEKPLETTIAEDDFQI